MKKYTPTHPNLWGGRKSKGQLYLHEKVVCINLEKENIPPKSKKTIALLGYTCEEGVKRNQGRVGTINGPDAIRKQLGKMPNHLSKEKECNDAGNLDCIDGDMETTQDQLSEKVCLLLKKGMFPILMGGGHDIAYGHYNGIKKHLEKDKTIGIINFDAHFDLRSNANGNNSGTPFYQIAQDCKKEKATFKYLCLGIRKDANDRVLFQTAKDLRTTYIENEHFTMYRLKSIKKEIEQFIDTVDYVYTTIDLDGFSSAYAPGVSAASPMGFSPDTILHSLKSIIDSKKLVSFDIAEMNPEYDRDNQTAKLAASLVHFVMHRL